MRVLLNTEREGQRQQGRRHGSIRYSRIDATLWQSKEEVKIGVYPGGEDDNIDDLFA